MKVTVKINHAKLKAIDKTAQDALVKTADATLNDLKQSQTMPFDTGQMQNRATSIDASKKAQGRVRIVTDTPYARRLYFHPEYNFKTDKNPNAQGLWLDTYKKGQKKGFIKNAFMQFWKKGGEI